MNASKATASRYGSVHNINGLLGSEHHRRTSSIKRSYNDSSTSPPSTSHAHPETAQRFSSWKFPPAGDQELPAASDGLIGEAGLNRIEESGSDDSDDTFSSSSGSSPTSSGKHRTSASLPYGPLMPPYSSAYNQRHGASLFRIDRASVLQFLQSHVRKLKPLQASYAFIFLACLFIFLTALTGVGYQSAAVQTIPLPPTEAPILIPREPEYALPDDAQPSLRSAAARQLYDDIKPIQPPPRRVEPLKAQRLENNVPLIIADDNDPPEEVLPAWARTKAARRRKAALQAAAAARQEQQEPAPLADTVAQPGQGQDEEEPSEDASEEVDQLIEDDLQHLRDQEEAHRSPERENYAEAEEVINNSPADPALDDEHAAHYHHADDTNIFAKAPTNPHDHTHHGAPAQDETAQDDGQAHQYELELNEEGQYIVKAADEVADSEEGAAEANAAEEEEYSFQKRSAPLRRAIRLR